MSHWLSDGRTTFEVDWHPFVHVGRTIKSVVAATSGLCALIPLTVLLVLRQNTFELLAAFAASSTPTRVWAGVPLVAEVEATGALGLKVHPLEVTPILGLLPIPHPDEREVAL